MVEEERRETKGALLLSCLNLTLRLEPLNKCLFCAVPRQDIFSAIRYLDSTRRTSAASGAVLKSMNDETSRRAN
jgi:hypothetical protein